MIEKSDLVERQIHAHVDMIENELSKIESQIDELNGLVTMAGHKIKNLIQLSKSEKLDFENMLEDEDININQNEMNKMEKISQAISLGLKHIEKSIKNLSTDIEGIILKRFPNIKPSQISSRYASQIENVNSKLLELEKKYEQISESLSYSKQMLEKNRNIINTNSELNRKRKTEEENKRKKEEEENRRKKEEEENRSAMVLTATNEFKQLLNDDNGYKDAMGVTSLEKRCKEYNSVETIYEFEPGFHNPKQRNPKASNITTSTVKKLFGPELLYILSIEFGLPLEEKEEDHRNDHLIDSQFWGSIDDPPYKTFSYSGFTAEYTANFVPEAHLNLSDLNELEKYKEKIKTLKESVQTKPEVYNTPGKLYLPKLGIKIEVTQADLIMANLDPKQLGWEPLSKKIGEPKPITAKEIVLTAKQKNVRNSIINMIRNLFNKVKDKNR